jgi:hypothetical protein
MDMSEAILNLVPRKKRGGGGSKNLCSTRDQVAKLFSAILGTRVWGGVPKWQWYGSIPFYRLWYQIMLLAMAAILYLVTLAENRWQQ